MVLGAPAPYAWGVPACAPRRSGSALFATFGAARRSTGAVAGALVTLAAACGGHSQSLASQYNASQLECLVTLQSDCCGSGSAQTCIAAFTAAEECSSWGGSTAVAVFPTACQGMTAVRTTLAGNSYSSFYVYDASGTLYAIGDNATSPDPRSGAIACGAGPSGWVIPTACADVWLGSSGSRPCAPGVAAITSICR